LRTPRENEAMAEKLGYRPGLDGVRGLAIVLVLVLHWWPASFPGGYIGVDLFFVLSGFLITRLLIEEADQRGGTDLRAFYTRRARRLMPALAALLAVCVTVPQAWMVAAYVANWARVGGHLVGGPLEHTWSLAIEEQFYLAWPMVFLMLRRFQWVELILSLLISVVLLHRLGVDNPDRAINGFDTRADGLLVGCLAAFAAPLLARRRVWVVVAAGSVALMSWWTVAGFEGHRWGYTLVALVCIPLVYAGCQVATVAPLRALGVLSYSLYLWHYPVTWWLRGGNIYNTSAETTALAIVLTAGTAFASYRLIELPLRHRANVLREPGDRVGGARDEQAIAGSVLASS
jgi:peptidoglycan/LPS O-acetylase OafA/YrhL